MLDEHGLPGSWTAGETRSGSLPLTRWSWPPQDTLEWRYKVYNMKNIIGGILAIPLFLLCLYLTFTG